MSGSDDKDSQCETTAESNGIVMGDVLAKEHNEDTSRDESTDSEDELRLHDQRQEADGAPELSDVMAKLVVSEPVSMDVETNDTATPSIDENNEELSSVLGAMRALEHQEQCTCETCTNQRAFLRDQVVKVWKWQSQGLKVRQYVRSVFNAAIESPCVPNIQKYEYDPAEYEELQHIVDELVKNHPHKFFLMLVIQAHEFVVELKIRIMRPLEDDNLARISEIFLTRLLNGYDILIATAVQVSELIKPLEEKHLNKFDLTWEFFNKKLYQNYIYFYEPTIRNILPSVVGQLRKPRKGKGYQVLLERYLGFVDEMMRIAGLWPEKELLIDKFSSKQVDRIVEKHKKIKSWTLWTIQEAVQVDAERAVDVPGVGLNQAPFNSYLVKWLERLGPTPDTDQIRRMLDDWGREAYQTLAQNFLGIHWYKPEDPKKDRSVPGDPSFYFGYQVAAWLVLSRPSDSSMEVDTECAVCQDSAWVSHLVVGGRTKTGACAHPTMKINGEITPPLTEEPTSVEPQTEKKRKGCLCTYRHLGEWQGSTLRGLLAFPPCLCMLNMRRLPESVCPCVRDSPLSKPSGPSKNTDQVSTQTSSKEIVTDVNKSTNSKGTTQTQTRHSTTQTPTAPHNHNHSGHQGRCSTHTHGHGPPGDGVKPTASSHKASHSHNSHGGCHKQSNIEQIKRVQSCNNTTPPLDGNCSDSGSNEDSCSTGGTSSPRDNGRHCDCCYCEVFGHGVPSVAPVSRNYNETRERLRQLLTKKKAKKCKSACSPPMSPAESVPSNANSENNSMSINSGPRSNTPVSTTSTVQTDQQRDQRDLDALLEFIEGNQLDIIKKDNKKSEKKARQKQRKLDEVMRKQQQELERQKLVELQKKTPEVTITVVDPQKPAPKRPLSNRNLPEVSILPATVPVPQKSAVNSKKSSKQPVTNNREKSTSDKNTRAISIDATVSLNQSTKDSGKSAKGKNNKNNSKNSKPPPPPAPAPVVSEPEPEVPLTKKQRQKLKREMKKMEEAMAKEQPKPAQPDNQPQIVTIKRVMESNCAEPTVTITLKGQTPAEDKVLFTLVNGQTKEPAKEQSTQNPSGKKKKKKNQQGSNSDASTNPLQQNVQQTKTQQNLPPKSQPVVKMNDKNSKQQSSNEKPKGGNKQQAEEKKPKPVTETKSTKSSKKDKKNAENKQPVQQTVNTTKGKNQQQEVKTGKKQNKSNVFPQPLTEIKVQSNVNNVNESSGKKVKGQSQQQQDKSNQSGKNNKSNSKQSTKIDNQKNQPKTPQPAPKQRTNVEAQRPPSVPGSSFLGSQLKDASSKINIENLKLPPGITITKVDVPAKSLPIKSTPLAKPASAPKQATIIAAPMTGLQSNYGGSQSGGNVIVVDTGKLKQDLLPKNEKEMSKEQSSTTSSKKKKKKKKNTAADSNNSLAQKSTNEPARDHNDDQAKIVHSPGSNMVTIRNPAFGSVPKMEPLQQAAIIKLSDNGMVTIRSPALQQAINAGLTPPPKPDFIVKGDFMTANTSKTSTTTITPTNSTGHQCANGIITSSLAELRSRLTPDCTGITGLANIQISKVTNGQPIPENGINLKGTSVTLTKVRNPEFVATSPRTDDSQQTAAGKGKKKKKRGNGGRPCGDDWNLVGEKK